MNYRNARYIDAARIDCEIEHHIHGWIPYTLDPADTDMTVNNDDLLAAMAENGDVAAYVPPTQAELDALAADQIRAERDFRLSSEVDVIAGNALRWAALTPEKQAEWAEYRQALLDVPQQSGFPHEVSWPTPPVG
jgi:hypothetical protein